MARKLETYKPPAQYTARIEVKATPEEKEAIYAAALLARKPVTRYLVDTAMEKINRMKKGKDDE